MPCFGIFLQVGGQQVEIFIERRLRADVEIEAGAPASRYGTASGFDDGMFQHLLQEFIFARRKWSFRLAGKMPAVSDSRQFLKFLLRAGPDKV